MTKKNFTEEQVKALGHVFNKFRLYTKSSSFTADDLKYWQKNTPGLEIIIPTNKNYLSQYVKKGIISTNGKGGYKFEDWTKPILGLTIATAIKLARTQANAATARWEEKRKARLQAPEEVKKEKTTSTSENTSKEEPVIEVIVTNPVEDAIKLLKSYGYKIYKPRVEYDLV